MEESSARATSRRLQPQMRQQTSQQESRIRTPDFLRQSDLVTSAMTAQATVVIGTGGIGGPTVLTLAKMGFQNLEIWDPDIVEALNVPTQLWKLSDIGQTKVRAMKEMVQDMIGTDLVVKPKRWEPPVARDRIYVSAVDSMAARMEIWAAMKKSPPKIYIEARMGALIGIIYAVTESDASRYEATLYPDSEAVQEPCTAKATFFTGMGLGSLIAATIHRFLSVGKVPFETVVSFPELSVKAMTP